jgi:nucleotide-binding universal stress UspA family protein
MIVFTPNRRVIVGYDGSAVSHAALERAADVAGNEGYVYVVHAYPPPPSWLGQPYYRQRLDAALATAESTIEALWREAGGPLARAAWEPEIIAGDPSEVIAAVAAARHADEIVVGTGPVARALAELAECPVTVISERFARRISGLTDAA